MEELTPRDRVILEFEECHWGTDGAKLGAVLDTFGWSAATYYQHIIRIQALPAAAAEYPMLVKRIQRLIEERTERRSAGRFRAS